MDIDDILSPSDQKLVDAASAQINALGYIKDILGDRNSRGVTTSTVLGMLTCIIYRLCNVTVDTESLVNFLSSQAKGEE